MWPMLWSLCLVSLVTGQTLYYKPHKTITCPDKHGSCPDGNTCCMSNSGTYGCCPLPKAVCCKDRAHCCPAGYQCDVKGKSCIKADNTNSWIELRQSAPDKGTLSNKSTPHSSQPQQPTHKGLIKKKMICPGAKAYCDRGQTCCFKDLGQFTCCPFVNGVCCPDRAHCCPLGFTCDLKLSKCTKEGGLSLPWGETHESKKNEPEPENQTPSQASDSIICPDQVSTCPSDSTCCQLSDGEYGCCPLTRAVCCSDHLHCCPEGSVCDVQNGFCNGDKISLPWMTKQQAKPIVTTRTGSQCADNKTTCPEKTTCCPMLDGYYACCPFENAKCCPDKLHCCPSDEECDVEKGECIKPNSARSLMQQLGSYAPQTKDIVCPDKSVCPSGATCCQIADGNYGCCPFSNAVCCPDLVHCCPDGYICDANDNKCKSSAETIPWVSKKAAQKVAAPEDNQAITDNNVICPDKKSFCPDQTTCCLLESKQYGCCPLPNAVCCSDGEHCCPSGYTCNVINKTCQKTVLWQTHARPKPASGANAQWVVCPDHVSQCPDGQTCCPLSQSKYGCCPLPDAVCCSDHVHCCPRGTVCNSNTQMCESTSNSLRISWSHMNTQTLSTQNTITMKLQEEIKCADKTVCPTGSTCCIMKSGSYGCCPYQKGVCCADRIHCCPAGFKCDKSSLRCEKQDSSITLTSTMFTHFKPHPPASDPDTLNNIKCPDGKEQCPDNNTCCKQTSGQYGCCPFQNAVCCSDGTHCCPEGYACDIQSGTCTQIIGWLQKLETVRTSANHHIICPDDKHWCPSNDTCCQLSSSEWGCCPLPQAECCSDRKHCCPHGYKCNTENETCEQQGSAPIAFLRMTTKAANTDKP